MEIWEEDELVAQAWRDDQDVLIEFANDRDGDPFIMDVPDLATALDNVTRILGDEGDAAGGVDPVEQLAEQFDHLAVKRGPEDEGFYPPPVAVRMIRHCEALGLAVVSMEGFQDVAGELVDVPGHRADLGAAHEGEAWPTFRAGCNVQAEALVEKWVRTRGLLIAFEVRDSAGESYIL